MDYTYLMTLIGYYTNKAYTTIHKNSHGYNNEAGFGTPEKLVLTIAGIALAVLLWFGLAPKIQGAVNNINLP
ncbi:MAG: hypothetical protein M1483_06385 [Actinobacteria bacterium]|jgi:hypothetical protein|nr:hypothetical protein [Actinomycetota bacterium]MCL6105233.1 hypothetical protein [Actinomycetota bacterium]